MGVSDKVGSLEVGKQATLLITTGTPIDMTSEHPDRRTSRGASST